MATSIATELPSSFTKELNNTNDKNIQVPKLLEILNDKIDPTSNYSKINFVKFLVDKHCIENYEFYTELLSIVENYDFFKRHNSTSEWFSIYNQFIETEIINLPGDIVLQLSKNHLPCLSVLNKIEKIILNYLLASYYEFISDYKLSKNNDISTSSSTTNSSIKNASNLESPDLTSINSDNSYKVLIEDLNLNLDLDSDSNVKTKASNSDSNIYLCCNNGENGHEYEKQKVQNSNSNSTTKSSPKSSLSNFTVCESCDDDDDCNILEPKSWGKLTKKIKWRRKSNS